MAAGDATSADVPGKYDCVIDGKGYVFADSVEPSLPFRTHRAIYDISQTFVERQNVSQSYGDQSQDFFLTSSQNDWSEGEQQRFFRLTDQDSIRKYWAGSNVDVVTLPGQISIQPAVKTLTFASTIVAAGVGGNGNTYAASTTNLYEVSPSGSITDHGAHGAGTPNGPKAICNDGFNTYIAGSTAIRKWSGVSFSTFSSATGATALAFLNNTLYSLYGGVVNGLAHSLRQYDTSGTETTIFTWQNASGGGIDATMSLVGYGGKLLILRSPGDNIGAELWIYESDAPSKVIEFPKNFSAFSLCVLNGIGFIGGSFVSGVNYESAVYYYANGSEGLLWRARSTTSTSTSLTCIGDFQGRVVWTDETNGKIISYDPVAGGVSTIGSFTAGSTSSLNTLSAGSTSFLITRDSVTGYLFPDSSIASTATVSSSLIDFESSLTKVFRGIKVDWQSATDGNGGSVDIAYQVDSLDGSYTNLQTGATSGTEYTLSNVSGHAISVKITLNKGTSTAGPILKRVYVRAAPQLQQFRSGLYIIDCTGTAEQPRELRDNTFHPLVGYDQVQNLLTAAKSTTPFSVTDRVNGTFTALVDLSDSEGWDVYEVHPSTGNKEHPGSYLVRIKLREV